MNERLKSLRKFLNLSQEEFGARLGVTGTGISRIEKGTRNFTEQMIKAVCREFNVDYMWLTSGEGEMFSEVDYRAVDLIDRIMSGENEFAKRVFKAFAALDESEWKVLEKLIDNISDKSEKKPTH